MNRKYGIGKEEIDKMIALYSQGENCGEIAKIMQLSTRSLVRHYLKDQGVKIRQVLSQGETPSLIDVNQWKNLYIEQGFNLRDIGEIYRVGVSTVRRYLIDGGVMMRPPVKREFLDESQKLDVIKDYKSGFSMSDCSQKYGVSTNTIHFILHKADVDTKTNRMIKFRNKRDQQTIVSMYNAGWSLAGIEKKLETSRDSIKAVLRLYGIEVKSYGELYGHIYENQDKRIPMNSPAEVAYAKWLDSNGIQWDYEKEHYDLGELGKYTPDFWLYAKGKLSSVVELRWCTGVSRKFRNKIKAAEKKYEIQVTLLLMRDLKRLGINV